MPVLATILRGVTVERRLHHPGVVFTARHILEHITPSRLRLLFTCDVDELRTAHQVLKPLQQVRNLRDCAIQLHQVPNTLLQDFAHKVAIQAIRLQTFTRSDHVPFRFLDLPYEVRHQILSYTDLITPLNEVNWSPKEDFHLRYSQNTCNGAISNDVSICPLPFHNACDLRDCRKLPPRELGCFCRRYHAAYISKYQCWSPPRGLFRVCRIVREDALAVFFKGNKFIIMPSNDPHVPLSSTPARLHVSIFLIDTVPRQALQHLRSLELVFPPLVYENAAGFLNFKRNAYQEWMRTVQTMKAKCSVDLLTVRIYIGNFAGYNIHAMRNTPFGMTDERESALLEAYMRTLSPFLLLNKRQGPSQDGSTLLKIAEINPKHKLSALESLNIPAKRLHRLFLHAAWPTRRTWFVMNRPFTTDQETSAFEQMCERRIMRDDTYDSERLGKHDEEKSQWLLKAWRD